MHCALLYIYDTVWIAAWYKPEVACTTSHNTPRCTCLQRLSCYFCYDYFSFSVATMTRTLYEFTTSTPHLWRGSFDFILWNGTAK